MWHIANRYTTGYTVKYGLHRQNGCRHTDANPSGVPDVSLNSCVNIIVFNIILNMNCLIPEVNETILYC